MSESHQTDTVDYARSSVAIKTLRIEVLEGPDAGRSAVAESETLSVGTGQGNTLVFTDPTVSRFHAELSRHHDGILIVDHGSKNGTTVGSTSVQRAIVPPGTEMVLGHSRVRVTDSADRDVELLDASQLSGLIGKTPIMRRLMAETERAAKTDAAVLLVGESGTGKEVVAQALHDCSSRADGPFVTVDCGALSPTLIASELFGHERGAFTGATRQHIGAFERADSGTLFLDEISDLPSDLQPMLLGALERRKFRRVGGEREIPVDIRVVSAAQDDPRKRINSGSFRLDLYYRLAVIVLRVPSLRDRTADIPMLAQHFASEAGHAGALREILSPQTLDALASHRWPGNVRELRNFVEGSIAMGEPRGSGLDEAIEHDATTGNDVIDALIASGVSYKSARERLRSEFESRFLRFHLTKADGNVSLAARTAQMDRSYFIQLMRRHGLR